MRAVLLQKMKSSLLVLRFAGILLLAIAMSHQTSAQDVIYYQYRKVLPANVDEFLKRETTYWSKVAQKGMDNGKIEFWGSSRFAKNTTNAAAIKITVSKIGLFSFGILISNTS